MSLCADYGLDSKFMTLLRLHRSSKEILKIVVLCYFPRLSHAFTILYQRSDICNLVFCHIMVFVMGRGSDEIG